MHLLLLGVNHKTAPVEVRESLAFAAEEIPALASALRDECDLDELAILSTCNRTEVMAVSRQSPASAGRRLIDSLSRRGQRRAARSGASSRATARLQSAHFYTYTDEEAADHLFRVAAGLDSLVVGEPQVLGQVRQSLGLAVKAQTISLLLRRLLETALRVGKRARTETRISEGAASVSHAAVELAARVFGDLKGKHVLLVGAGKMSELAARNLAEHGISAVFVANRTFARAQEMARSFRGQAIRIEGMAAWLQEIDIVISSTGAPAYVITEEMVRQALPERKGRPLFLIDIAVPRDIDPNVHQLEGVFLYNVDDLHEVVQANLEQRQAYIEDVEAIISDETAAFTSWLKERQAVPVIAHMRREAEKVRKAELERALRRLDHLPEEDKEHIRALTVALMNKLLHGPTVRLKDGVKGNEGRRVLQAAAQLYNFPQPEPTAQEEDENGAGALSWPGGDGEVPHETAGREIRLNTEERASLSADDRRRQNKSSDQRWKESTGHSAVASLRALTSQGGYPV